MLAVTTVTEEILDLKRERKAILLAHHYQESEIQEMADWVGDSLELARKARDFEGDVIAFCGVWFMAETAKVLNPTRIVVVPDRDAGCSLVDSCPVEQVRAFRRRHPDHAVVSYINTSVEVKAESDILCTSRNAVQVVNSIPAGPAHPVPARHQPRQLREETDRAREHADLAGRLHRARHISCAPRRRGQAAASRTRWWPRIRNARDRCWRWPISSAPRRPSSNGASRAMPHEFIVMTESGVRHSLQKLAPREAILLRGQRELQLQRVPVHEAEHAREVAGLPA